jgi:hypothetical protein
VFYLSSPPLQLKKPPLNSTANIHLSTAYQRNGSINNPFSEFIEIKKLLDLVMKPFDLDKVEITMDTTKLPI